jgi:serine protease AprX
MYLLQVATAPRQKAVWGPKRIIAIVAMLLVALAPDAMAQGRHARQGRKAVAGGPNSHVKSYKLDNELTFRAAANANRKTRVILELLPGAVVPRQFSSFATRNGRLKIINGVVLDLPDRQLRALAAHPSVFRIHHDRPAATFNYRTSLTVGSKVVRDTLGLTGAGVGVAVIDSGIATWHDDLTNTTSTLYPHGNQRVAKFVDFVNGQGGPYDDNGHGTHVAGIIAGNGYDSDGQKSGAAPEASLISLKVLDANGVGTISNIIAALDWVLENHVAYNIRVVNMSVGAAIHESAWTDPLTLAAKRVVDAGVVVVGAAGNFGKNTAGLPQYGGISAPGNAPWVLTVGGSSTNGTPRRTDDTMGGYSSRGPSYIDWNAKPDLVAPGTGTVSLAAAGSTFYQTRVAALLPGSIATAYLPYLSLSGTSMAAPVVSGTVALMLQANPSLTPNAVKAILQYTAQQYPGYNGLTQGAGFLNVVGAVRLARFYATATPGATIPVQKMWSKHIIWGNHRLGKGTLNLSANAFRVGTNWGVAKTDDGDNIVWGTACSSADCDNIVWGTDAGDNIVWGTSEDGDNIVWGTAEDGDNIVWGTDCGGADCDNIVWGTADPGDNIVWGTADAGDNIVWGTDDGDNIVWGTDDGDNIVWGTAGQVQSVWLESKIDQSQTPLTGAQVFDRLKDKTLLKLLEYAPPPVAPPPPPPVDPPPAPPVDPPPAPPVDPPPAPGPTTTTTTTVTTTTDAVTSVTTTVTTTTTTAADPVTGVTTTTVTTTTDTTDPATGVTTTSVSTVTV